MRAIAGTHQVQPEYAQVGATRQKIASRSLRSLKAMDWQHLQGIVGTPVPRHVHCGSRIGALQYWNGALWFQD